MACQSLIWLELVTHRVTDRRRVVPLARGASGEGIENLVTLCPPLLAASGPLQRGMTRFVPNSAVKTHQGSIGFELVMDCVTHSWVGRSSGLGGPFRSLSRSLGPGDQPGLRELLGHVYAGF